MRESPSLHLYSHCSISRFWSDNRASAGGLCRRDVMVTNAFNGLVFVYKAVSVCDNEDMKYVSSHMPWLVI